LDADSIEAGSRPFTMRAAASSYVVFGAIFGLLLALVLAPALRGRPLTLNSGGRVLLEGWPATLAISGVPAAFGLYFFTWLRAFRLEVREDRLEYTALLRGTVSMPFSEIAAARYCIGGRRRRGDPYVRLELDPRPGSLARPLRINLKVFGARDVGRLLRRVNEACPFVDGT
jgi:hypothetical protein